MSTSNMSRSHTLAQTPTLNKKHKCFGGSVEFYTHSSYSTQTPMRYTLFRPPVTQPEQPLPVLFWLSGLTCTEENFTTKAGAYRMASELGLVIVCPDTSPRGTQLPGEHDSYDFGQGASFYLNATTPGYADHYRMEDYLVEELPQIISRQLPLPPTQWGIFGHSMGGHGALVLGLRNPHLFQTISAFAPICSPTRCPWGQKAFLNYLGSDQEEWKKYDAVELLRQDSRRTPILVDQGTADEFLVDQLKPELLNEVAKQKGHPLELRYQEGYDHSYYFISTFIDDHLRFHSQGLRKAP